MRGIIIFNEETGKYVARPGSEHSYTPDILQARTFDTVEAAERERCGNELLLRVNVELIR